MISYSYSPRIDAARGSVTSHETENFRSFVNEILAFPRTADPKKRGYICAPMIDGHRCKESATDRTWIGLDMDGGTQEEFDLLLLRLPDYQAVAWTTLRHTVACPRLRIILALDRVVTPEEGKRLGDTFVSVIGRGLPTLRWDCKPHQGEWAHFLPMKGAAIRRYEGDPLSVDEILAMSSPMFHVEHVRGNGAASNGIDEPVAEGGRNNHLTSFAGMLRRKGIGIEGMHAALMAENASRCNPPLSEADVATIAKSVHRYEPEYNQQEIAPIFPVDTPDNAEIPKELIYAAPGVMGEYVKWYLETARNPEPVYALASALAFFTAAIGCRRHNGDVWLNTGCLTIGPTESGKERIMAAASRSLDEVVSRAANAQAVIVRGFESHFGSPEGIWWLLHDAGPAVLFDTEMGKLLQQSAILGTRSHEIMRAVMLLHDKVAYENVPPIRYSSRVKDLKKMVYLDHPFLGVHGTTTPTFYRKAKAMAAEDGSLNRLLILNCEGQAAAKCRENRIPLPNALIDFFNDFVKQQKEVGYADGSEQLLFERGRVVHPLVEQSPGTYGRFGIKSARVALMASVVRGNAEITTADVTWACDVVEAANKTASEKFSSGGGLSNSETDGLVKSILSLFSTTVGTSNGGKLNRRLMHQYSWRFRETDARLKDATLAGMVKDGLLTVVDGWYKME